MSMSPLSLSLSLSSFKLYNLPYYCKIGQDRTGHGLHYKALNDGDDDTASNGTSQLVAVCRSIGGSMAKVHLK